LKRVRQWEIINRIRDQRRANQKKKKGCTKSQDKDNIYVPRLGNQKLQIQVQAVTGMGKREVHRSKHTKVGSSVGKGLSRLKNLKRGWGTWGNDGRGGGKKEKIQRDKNFETQKQDEVV